MAHRVEDDRDPLFSATGLGTQQLLRERSTPPAGRHGVKCRSHHVGRSGRRDHRRSSRGGRKRMNTPSDPGRLAPARGSTAGNREGG